MIIADPNNKIANKAITDSTLNFKNGMKNGLHEVGAENVRHVRGLIRSTNKTGRIYFIKGRPHQASAPGESPANLTGNLANSADYKVRGHREMDFGEAADYATFLELGTSKMAPRPHVRRTVDERTGTNFMILQQGVLREII